MGASLSGIWHYFRGAGKNMRNASTKMVQELACQDSQVMALTADNRNEIYDSIREMLPKQYIDYGIAEETMVASAAGLASCGQIPLLVTGALLYSPSEKESQLRIKSPITSYPASFNLIAATEESTPPDIPITTLSILSHFFSKFKTKVFFHKIYP